MKKIFVSIILGLFVLGGCAENGVFIDEVAIHNNLVNKMDTVLTGEENFYNEYWELADDVDTTAFLESFEVFESGVNDLDQFFAETDFVGEQTVFADHYFDFYKPFIDEYLADAKEFTEIVETEGFVYQRMEPYFANIDQKTIDFIDTHNSLIDVINAQSDYAAVDES